MNQTTGYFLYASKVRDGIIKEFRENNKSVSVSVIGKQIGQQWQTLPQEEKDGYNQEAKELKQQYNEQNYDKNQQENGGDNCTKISQPSIPISLLKRLCQQVDPDSRLKYSKNSLQALNILAEVFISDLTEESVKITKIQKRHTIKTSDMESAVMDVPKFRESPLQDLFQNQLKRKSKSLTLGSEQATGVDQSTNKSISAFFQTKKTPIDCT